MFVVLIPYFAFRAYYVTNNQNAMTAWGISDLGQLARSRRAETVREVGRSGTMMTNNYAIEVESNAVADLTGRLGTAVVTYRGYEYRIPMAGGRGITMDGHRGRTVATVLLDASALFCLHIASTLIMVYKEFGGLQNMPTGARGEKRPADANGCAVKVAQLSVRDTAEALKQPSGKVRNRLAGGETRADERQEIAMKKAATGRWR
jgi:hypothetical protein